jgi:uncharacterized protein
MAENVSSDSGIFLQLKDEEKAILLSVALESITHGLRYRRPLEPDPEAYPGSLREPRAVFVTLTLLGELRGCIGTFEAAHPLVMAVAKYAYASAFSDSRFPAVTATEVPDLAIHISMVNPLSSIVFESEQDLLNQIRPGIDGLWLEEGGYRGTLLPSVWEDIPEPAEFLRRLKMKAGLSPNYWSPHIRVRRYTTESIKSTR